MPYVFEARAGEIDALKKAKAVLSGADYSLVLEPPKDWRQDLAEIATAEMFGNFGIFGCFGNFRFFFLMFFEILEFLECLEYSGILPFYTKKAP